MKEAKATYHQRWWYPRPKEGPPVDFPKSWRAPVKLDDLFNEAWGSDKYSHTTGNT